MRPSKLGRAEAELRTRSPIPLPPSKQLITSKAEVPAGVVKADKAGRSEADIETQTPTPPPAANKRGRPPKSAISSQECQALRAPMFLFGHDPNKALEGPRWETRKQAQDSQRPYRTDLHMAQAIKQLFRKMCDGVILQHTLLRNGHLNDPKNLLGYRDHTTFSQTLPHEQLHTTTLSRDFWRLAVEDELQKTSCRR